MIMVPIPKLGIFRTQSWWNGPVRFLGKGLIKNFIALRVALTGSLQSNEGLPCVFEQVKYKVATKFTVIIWQPPVAEESAFENSTQKIGDGYQRWKWHCPAAFKNIVCLTVLKVLI